MAFFARTTTTHVTTLCARAYPKSPLRTFATAAQVHTLPDLPYDYAALEPIISGEIMQLHHKKHHQSYVTNLNQALEKYTIAETNKNIKEQIALQSAIKFNGGGHINHSIFWTNLASKNKEGGVAPSGELSRAITGEFGSLEKFIEKFNSTTAAIQGSGWGWLGYCKEQDKLQISTQGNQDPLIGLVPLLGIDVWEHAYYLQYKNARADYLKAIWQVVNWSNVAQRYADAKK